MQIELTRAILTQRLKFFVQVDHAFSHVFIFGNMCPESRRLQTVSKIHVSIYPYLVSEERRNCSSFWSAQQRNNNELSANMLANIITCENWRSNFSENLGVVTIKLFELSQVKVKDEFFSERKFTKNIKIFLQLYMIKTDLLTCHQDLDRGGCY